MMHNHPLAAQMLSAMTPEVKGPAKAKTVFDSVEESDAPQGAAAYAAADMRLKAAAIVHQWAETDSGDLADGESLADRLLALVVGCCDADKDGEISEAEQEMCDILLNAIWDFMSGKGASEDDLNALLNDWDAAAADRLKDLVASALPDGEEESAADMDAFAFDAESDEAVFDAVYKKKIVVRGGKKMRVNKRVSGHVRLSAKQKISIRKMLRKSHSAVATMHRMKSVRIRKRAGL